MHFSGSQANCKFSFNSVTCGLIANLFWPVSRIPHVSNGKLAIYALLMDLHSWSFSGSLPIVSNLFQILKGLHFEGFEVNCSDTIRKLLSICLNLGMVCILQATRKKSNKTQSKETPFAGNPMQLQTESSTKGIVVLSNGWFLIS